MLRSTILTFSLLCIIEGSPDSTLWKTHPILTGLTFGIGVVGLKYLTDGDKE